MKLFWPKGKKFLYHIVHRSRKPLDAEPTRQLRRASLRKREYERFGLGLGTRPVYDEPRRALRSIARSIAARTYREVFIRKTVAVGV